MDFITSSALGYTLPVNAWHDIPAAIATLQAAGALHRIPMLRALYAGRIAHFEAARNTSAGAIKAFMRAASLPAVVLLGDDDHASTGPAGWPIARRLLRWARHVVIHGTGPKPEHYEAAVQTAEHVGRVLFIETASDAVGTWRRAAEAAPQRPSMGLYLPTQGQHPIPPAHGAVQ